MALHRPLLGSALDEVRLTATPPLCLTRGRSAPTAASQRRVSPPRRTAASLACSTAASLSANADGRNDASSDSAAERASCNAASLSANADSRNAASSGTKREPTTGLPPRLSNTSSLVSER